MSGRRAVRLVIAGEVQGVFYRAWTQERARALGLAGWVRNRRDGGVEALLSGPAEQVETMIALCRQGPPAARVEEVSVAPAQGIVADRFDIEPTV